MTIEISGKKYEISELKNEWRVEKDLSEKVKVTLKVSKELCETFENLMAYLAKNEGLFEGAWYRG